MSTDNDIALPTLQEAIKGLSGRLQTLEETQSLIAALEALQGSWGCFQAMLERNNLSDLLTYTVRNNKVIFELNTPYHGNKGFEKGEHYYLTFMKIDLEESLDVSFTNSAFTKLMLTYVEAQHAMTGALKKLDMFTAGFQEILNQLNKEFKKYNQKLTKDKLVELLLIVFFQEAYILQPVPVNKTVEMVCTFTDFSNIVTALNMPYVHANGGEPLDEKFAEDVKGLPKDWVVSFIKPNIHDF